MQPTSFPIFEAMNYGVCLLSNIPCRSEGRDPAEMVTQLLFGESYTVIEALEKWIKIRIHHDGYECWICAKQHHPIPQKEFDRLNNADRIYSTDIIEVLQCNDQMHPVPLGVSLPGLNNETFSIDGKTFQFQGNTSSPSAKASKQKIIEDAFMFIGAPYLWGGRTPFGIDCSGFTQMVYQINNIQLPRDASQQVDKGSNYSFVEEAEAGDLAFFDNEEGQITHVGILLNEGKIIHASGKVRIDKLDHHGIFNEETGKYTHKLRIIKNLL